MIKRTLAGVAVALAATTSFAETGSVATDGTVEAAPLMLAGVRVGNPFDPSTWWDASQGSHAEHEMVAVNFADPEFWMGFVRPETHSRNHMTFTNPQTWADFMTPQFYAQMMDPDVWMKWMDMDTYAPLADPQTFAYWLQPGAYGHVLNTDNYAQLAELDNYKAGADKILTSLGLSAYFAEGPEAVAE